MIKKTLEIIAEKQTFMEALGVTPWIFVLFMGLDSGDMGKAINVLAIFSVLAIMVWVSGLLFSALSKLALGKFYGK